MYHSAVPVREKIPHPAPETVDNVTQVAARLNYAPEAAVFACAVQRIWSAGRRRAVMHIPANMCTYKAGEPRRGRTRDHGTGWEHTQHADLLLGRAGEGGGIYQGTGWGDGAQHADLLLGRAV